MATKVIWYSQKKDDVSRFAETLQEAERICKSTQVPFNQLVNLAIRQYLGLKINDRLSLVDASIRSLKRKISKPKTEKKAAIQTAASEEPQE